MRLFVCVLGLAALAIAAPAAVGNSNGLPVASSGIVKRDPASALPANLPAQAITCKINEADAHMNTVTIIDGSGMVNPAIYIFDNLCKQIGSNPSADRQALSSIKVAVHNTWSESPILVNGADISGNNATGITVTYGAISWNPLTDAARVAEGYTATTTYAAAAKTFKVVRMAWNPLDNLPEYVRQSVVAPAAPVQPTQHQQAQSMAAQTNAKFVIDNHTFMDGDGLYLNMTLHNEWLEEQHGPRNLTLESRQLWAVINGNFYDTYTNGNSMMICRIVGWVNPSQYTMSLVDSTVGWPSPLTVGMNPEIFIFDPWCRGLYVDPEVNRDVLENDRLGWSCFTPALPLATILHAKYFNYDAEIHYGGWDILPFNNIPGVQAGWIAYGQGSDGYKYLRMAYDIRYGYHRRDLIEDDKVEATIETRDPASDIENAVDIDARDTSTATTPTISMTSQMATYVTVLSTMTFQNENEADVHYLNMSMYLPWHAKMFPETVNRTFLQARQQETELYFNERPIIVCRSINDYPYWWTTTMVEGIRLNSPILFLFGNTCNWMSFLPNVDQDALARYPGVQQAASDVYFYFGGSLDECAISYNGWSLNLFDNLAGKAAGWIAHESTSDMTALRMGYDWRYGFWQ